MTCIACSLEKRSKESDDVGWTVTELRERLERRRRLMVEFAGDASLRQVLQEDIADIERELERRLGASADGPKPKDGQS
jgi:hypothetical protein